MSTSIVIGDFVIGDKIGEGTYSRVFLAERKTTSDGMYAIKIPKINFSRAESEAAHIKHEYEMLREFDHPHIIKVIDANEGDADLIRLPSNRKRKTAYIVFEHCENGELFKWISENGAMSDTVTRAVFRQILSAVQAMHEKGVSHGDLKPENILFDEML